MFTTDQPGDGLVRLLKFIATVGSSLLRSEGAASAAPVRMDTMSPWKSMLARKDD
jgi:hypothetical protein